VTRPALPIAEVPFDAVAAGSCGVPELDRVLGGGLVPGGVVLLAGEPGVGKSTLLLEVAAQTARSGRRALYVTGEESASQVRRRAERTGALDPRLFLAAETDLGAVLAHIEQVQPDLLVVDSVQTVSADGVDGVPGGVTQVREVAAAIVRAAKDRDLSTLIVGHVTKDGAIAGPRVLEHLVDVVLSFEGERSARLRLVRAVKNRYGPIDEVGCFDLTDDGIAAVTDPSGLFVSRHHQPVSGTCVAVSLEGNRPLLTEVQALAGPLGGEHPRRTTVGVDAGRTAMLIAVLHQRARLNLASRDVYVSTVGGARLADPAGDLAVALAIASSCVDFAIPSEVVAIGEIGLAGELRRVRELPRRLAEARRLGFGTALVPSSGEPLPPRREDGLLVIEVPTLAGALAALGVTSAR
jgi:DNA repair protein RadA/Sms